MNEIPEFIPGQRPDEEENEIDPTSGAHRKRFKIGGLPLSPRIGKLINIPAVRYLPIGDPIRLDQRTIDQVRNVDLSPPDLTYSNTPAENIHSDGLLQLRNQVLTNLETNDSVVISVPPGTLKDHAWFLRLTLESTDLNGKTVVVANATDDPNSPEAKANLARALHSAKYMKQEGVFVEDGGHILCPPYIRNVHTTASHSLKAVNGPEVGLSYKGSPQIKRLPEEIPAANTFNMAGVTKLPIVNIVRVQPGDPKNTIKLIDDAIRAGAEGIVVAGTGNGSVHTEVEEHLVSLARGTHQVKKGQQIPVVISTVVGAGEVTRNGIIQHDEQDFGCSGKLGPEEACIQLQVAMVRKQVNSPENPGLTIAETQALFVPYQTPEPKIEEKEIGKKETLEEAKEEPQVAEKNVDAPEATVDDPETDRKHAKIFGHKLGFTIPLTEKPEKVLILVMATGGTISSGGSAKSYTPKLGGAELVNTVGRPSNTKIDVIDVYKKDSKNLEYADLIKLRDSILENYKNYDSIVITHGSDTLAYTANFLRHTLPDEVFSKVSIALTGSMVPPLQERGQKVKPDGPGNLRSTFTLGEFCARLSTKGQTDHNSVFAVLNELCLETPYIAKKNTTAKSAISANNAPPVGKVSTDNVKLDRVPEPRKWEFNIPDAASIPPISVFHIEPTAPPENTITRIKAAACNEQGIVIAAPPPGKMPTEVKDYLEKLATEEKKAVIIATSANSGPTPYPKGYKGNLIYAGNLDVDMARQFLQLTLADPNAQSKLRPSDATVDKGETKSIGAKIEDSFRIKAAGEASTKTKSASLDKIKDVFSDYQPKTMTPALPEQGKSKNVKI